MGNLYPQEFKGKLFLDGMTWVVVSKTKNVLNFFTINKYQERCWLGGLTGSNNKPAPREAIAFQIDRVFNCPRDVIPEKYWLSNGWTTPIYDYWKSKLKPDDRASFSSP